MKIQRVRYIILTGDSKEIFCGLAKNYQFKPVDNIGNTAIKTYLSENKAKSSFLDSWYRSEPEDFENGKYIVKKVIETIEIMEESL